MGFIRSGAVVTGATFTNAVVSFAGVIILANIISQSNLGTFFLFQATLGLLSIPAAAGINGAIEKRISQGEHKEETLGTALVIKVIILIVLICFVFLFKKRVETYLGISASFLLIIGLIFQESSQVVFRTLRGEKRVAIAATLQSLQTISWIGGSILAAFVGWGTKGLIYSLLGSYLLMAISGSLLQRTGVGKFSVERFRSLISYAKHNVITSTGGTIYGWMDTAILGLFVGPSLIAAYEIAWRISKIGLVISTSVAMTTFPQISEWEEQKEYKVISNTVSESLIPTFLIVIPAFFATLLLAPDILYVIYGSEYVVAAGAFIVLALERVIKAGNQIYSRCLHAINRPDLSVHATLVAIMANLVLNWILIQEFGILGAAIATSISFALKFAIEYIYMSKIISIPVPRKELMIILVTSVIMTLFLFLLRRFLQSGSTTSLVIQITTGSICYFVILLLFPTIRQRIIVVLDQMRPNV